MIALARLPLAERAADRVVAWRGAERLTWERFRAEVGGAAQQLRSCRRVALVCQDSWCFAVALFGGLSAGAAIVLPPNAQPATLAALRADTDRVIDDSFEPGHGQWRDPLDDRALNLHFHTSGSTGEAKLIRRSLGQMTAEVAALHGLWGTALGEAPVLATVPHQHVYGLMFKLLWPLAAGRPFFTRQHDHWEDVAAEMPEGAVLVTSPAHLTRLGGLAPLAAARRPGMILSAGAPLPEGAAEEARRVLGVPVTEIYGSTETGAIATRRRDGGDHPWIPLPGYAVRLGAAGGMRLDAPDTVEGGWIELADRIEPLAAGGFRLLGRADRIAKIEGKRVSLDEVEHALAALPEVEAAAVLVLATPRPVLAAVVVASAEGRAALADQGGFRFGRVLRRALAERLEPAGLPRRWRFVAALPVGVMGKRRAEDLAALFEAAGHD